jgi:hypothetical protein
MRRRNYLNVILTVNAVLLAGLLWTQIAGRPLVSAAHAQDENDPANQGPSGIPNAGKQRDVMITHLASIEGAVRDLQRTIMSGKIKVEVKNLDELSKAANAASREP